MGKFWLVVVAAVISSATFSCLDQGNLHLKEGAPTVPLGSLAHVEKQGTGSVPVILLVSGGTGWKVWSNFMDLNKDRYTCYAVEAPGDGGTPCYSIEGAYTEQRWVNGVADGIVSLIKSKHLNRPVLIGEQQGAAQILTRVALREPGLVRGVVNIAGRPALIRGGAKIRERVTTTNLAPFFDKVDLKTWISGNWKSKQLSVNPKVGDELARAQNEPLNLTAQVTWLLEFGTMDLLEELPQLKIPMLVFDLPGLTMAEIHENNRVFYEKTYGSFDKGVAAMNAIFLKQYGSLDKARETLERTIWADAPGVNSLLRLKIEKGTGIFMTKDIPDEIDREIADFVKTLPH